MTVADGPAAEPPRGRTRVTSRALSRVVSAVTAEALGVRAKHVGVELRDERGVLAVSVSTHLPLMALRRARGDDGFLERSGGSLLDRSERAQQVLRDRVATLTGSTVGPVTIRFTGATTQPEARVR